MTPQKSQCHPEAFALRDKFFLSLKCTIISIPCCIILHGLPSMSLASRSRVCRSRGGQVDSMESFQTTKLVHSISPWRLVLALWQLARHPTVNLNSLLLMVTESKAYLHAKLAVQNSGNKCY